MILDDAMAATKNTSNLATGKLSSALAVDDLRHIRHAAIVKKGFSDSISPKAESSAKIDCAGSHQGANFSERFTSSWGDMRNVRVVSRVPFSGYLERDVLC